MRNFRKLEVWQDAIKLADLIFSTTHELKENELKSMVATLSTMALELPNAIAKGCAFDSSTFINYLNEALGICFALESSIVVLKNQDLIDEGEFSFLTENITSLQRRLSSLITKINQDV